MSKREERTVGIASFGDTSGGSKPTLRKVSSDAGVESVTKAEQSQQADTDEHEGTKWYEPAYPPEQLAALSERNEAHAACCSAKSRNVAGYGLDVVPDESIDADSPPGEDTVRDFWFGLNTTFQLGPDRQQATYSEVLEHAWDDYEQVGWLVLELLVNSSTGDPTGLAHIPAHTIRKLKHQRGYVQLGDGDVIEGYFGEAGDRYTSENNDEQYFINEDTGDVGTTTGEVGMDSVANELIVVRNYSALAPHYGTPDVIPALETVAGDISARKWNAKLFDNDTVPRMAVIVEGGELTDRAWEQLEKKFQKISLEENTHRSILIEAQAAVEASNEGQDDITISLEPLTVGMNEDADFLEYRTKNRRDILRAHDVPPVVIGDTDSVNYANAESQRVEFAQSTIRPKQERFAARLHQIIHVLGFGVEGWKPEFRLRNGENDEREAQVAQTRIEASMGSMTINEAREELGLPPLQDANENELPQGRMLLASLQQSGPAGQPSAEEVASAVEQARSSHRAQEHGYSITRRKALKIAKAQFGEGDMVEYDGEHLGVVVAVKRESFTVPQGDEGEEEVDASSDSPAYVVARETGGFGVFSESDLSSGSVPESEQASDPTEVAEVESMHKDGWTRLPDGWTRLTLLDAWSSMGGSFTGCTRHMADEGVRVNEFCASMKDEVLGTTRWRGRF